ncbi:hypothetical protein XELAEV_18000753mg [Xenopus laevis]|nr:hypothetical protein XELAEV_18000753mg [Xenopus laevis]
MCPFFPLTFSVSSDPKQLSNCYLLTNKHFSPLPHEQNTLLSIVLLGPKSLPPPCIYVALYEAVLEVPSPVCTACCGKFSFFSNAQTDIIKGFNPGPQERERGRRMGRRGESLEVGRREIVEGDTKEEGKKETEE